jgi:hypothetical protein
MKTELSGVQRQRQEGRQAVRQLRLIRRVALSGATASVASAVAALACSHFENGHAARPMNAVTHIVDGGEPPAHDGRNGRNTALGFAIHTAASIWWALFYEGLLGRYAGRGPLQAASAGALVSGVAYAVDYFVVNERFRPGFERYLSGRSMFAVYAALGLGFAAAALISRRIPPKARRLRAVRRRAQEPA